MNASAVYSSLANTTISKDAVSIKASKLIEYSSVVLFRTRSEGFCIAPLVPILALVLNVVSIVLSGELKGPCWVVCR